MAVIGFLGGNKSVIGRVFCLLLLACLSPTARAAHAISLLGEPKYPLGFAHFDYVNPQAPKGGGITFALVSLNSNFDKFNPYSLKGAAAPGLQELVFETLTVNSLDELNTQYGLLADDIQVDDELNAVTFRLNPQATFSNGDRVAPEDVVHSFEMLTGADASPRYKAYFSEVSRVAIVDSQHVRFEFSRGGRDISFIAGSLPVFSHKWGQGANGERKRFSQLLLDTPIASGPYVIDNWHRSRGITYRRNPDYWGKNQAARKGSFNFDQVSYKVYKDKDSQVAALRAGEFDFHSESAMRFWCCQYIGKRFDSGELIKHKFPHQNPPAMNGWVANLRKPKFQDVRIRKALNYALDYEWINDRIFDGEFKRIDSYFSGTPLAAKGLPSDEEIALLEPWRNELPAEVFGPMFEQPTTHVEGLSQADAFRRNLERALELFAEAGWTFRDGGLRNAAGERFTLEFFDRRVQHPYNAPIYENLIKLGIDVRIKVADPATEKAVLRDFNFDYRTVSMREARLPGDELWRYFNSAAADQEGSENYAGVKSKAIDQLIQKLLNARDQQQKITTARALDRVLIHGHYFVPWRYLTDHYVIYHRRLQHPQQLPLYYGANEWALATWWEDPSGTHRAD
jgi:microcin C transport system substrate-binding protein